VVPTSTLPFWSIRMRSVRELTAVLPFGVVANDSAPPWLVLDQFSVANP
jgi:hypothetical protein